MKDIDDKLRSLFMSGRIYQAREIAHALDLDEWAELLDLLLDHWHIIRGELARVAVTRHTEAQAGRLVKLAKRYDLIHEIGSCFSVSYQAVRVCKYAYHFNPDIRVRLRLEATR